jgi:predicted RNA binding protein YcfA (HicA-like mRNA interferase family)
MAKKTQRELIKIARKHGYKFVGTTGSGHLNFHQVNGRGVVVSSSTASCARARKNFVRDLLKQAT